MVILSNNDVFEVHLNSLLADYDRDTLTNLYQPIIGYEALAVYFTLWSESSVQKVLSFSTTEQLLIRMKMTVGKFVDARKLLEGVGLLKTRLEETKTANIYHYELFAPKTPRGFFNDALLYGMMIQALGNKNATRIKKIYESNNKEEGIDISSSFNDAFHPDYEDQAFYDAAISEDTAIGRNKGKIDMEFSYDKFFTELKLISQITENFISKKELKEITRLASLYGLDEKTAAAIVANNYMPENEKGSRLDFASIKEDFFGAARFTFVNNSLKQDDSDISSETMIAKKIIIYDKLSPLQLLSYLQNGTKAAPSDARIVEILSKDYRLANGPINVIIEFVLSMNKNVLSKAYAEKMAASFNREGIETTIDAMNYCNRVLNKNKKRAVITSVSAQIEGKKKVQQVNNTVTDEEWNKLFEDDKGEEKHGETDGELPF